MFKWVGKKDLIYWLLMLSMIIIFLTVFYFVGDEQLVSYFGFAGTIVGMILAIIALIYSFSQSITLGSAHSRLEDSAKKIEYFSSKIEKLDVLDNLSDEIEKSIESLKINVDSINSTVDQLAYTLTSDLRMQTNTINENFKALSESINPTRDDNEVPQLKWFLNSVHQSLLITLKILTICYERNEIININEVCDWIDKNNLSIFKNPSELETLTAVISYLGFFLQNGWLSVEGDFNDTKINNIKEELFNAVNEQYEQVKEQLQIKYPFKDFIMT